MNYKRDNKGTSRGVCPACGRNLPFSKAFWGLGKVFACKGCGESLFIPKVQFGVAIGGFLFLTYLAREFPFWLVLGIGIVLGYFDWLFMRVYWVETPVDDGHSAQDIAELARKPDD